MLLTQTLATLFIYTKFKLPPMGFKPPSIDWIHYMDLYFTSSTPEPFNFRRKMAPTPDKTRHPVMPTDRVLTVLGPGHLYSGV